MNDELLKQMNQFKQGKATQGLICIGDLNIILKEFQEATDSQIVLFDSNPEKALEFLLSQYNQVIPTDKKSVNSSVFIQQGNPNNKNAPKEFFKVFKTEKSDPFKVIVFSGLDEYIELFSDFYAILNAIIKDLKGKKIRMFLGLQFKKKDSYQRVKNAFEKIDLIEFENIFSSKIIQSNKKPLPQTLEVEPTDKNGEIPKQTVAKANEFKNKVVKALSVFEEPELPKLATEPEKLEKSINLFKSYVMELQAESDSDSPPNRNLIYKLEGLSEILINAQALLLKKLIEPLDLLLVSYFKRGVTTIGSIMSIARIEYTFMLLSEDKKKRYQFVKAIGEKLQLFNRIDYAVEFFHLALSISKSKEDAQIVSKYYALLAEEQGGFLARTYYYKALSSAYIAEEKTLIDQLTTKTEQTYKYKPSFPVF